MTHQNFRRKRLLLELLQQRGARGATFDDIREYIVTRIDSALPKRTLERDIAELRNTSGLDIVYVRKDSKYCIAADQDTHDLPLLQWYLELQELAQTAESILGSASKINSAIHFMRPAPTQGMQHFTALVQAITVGHYVVITYKKFEAEAARTHRILPRKLVSHRGRWYLLAEGTKNSSVRLITFGLDRIEKLEVLSQEPTAHGTLDAARHLADAFGIIITDEPQQTIRIWANTLQAQYFETLPLHPTQRVISKDKTGSILELHTQVDYELKTELLRYGPAVKVLAPESLIQAIKQQLNTTLKHYGKN